MKGRILTEKLNIRKQPHLSASILGTLRKNELVEIIGQQNSWYEIDLLNQSAFISSDYVETIAPRPPIKAQVTTDLLNVRDQAGTNGNIVGKLTRANQVDVIRELGDWLEISFNNQLAYIHRNYVSLTTIKPLKTAVVNASSLNVRKTADTNAIILGKLTKNSKVTIQSKSGSWYQIDFNGQSGFVHGDFITIPSENDVSGQPDSIVAEASVKTNSGNLKPAILLKTTGTAKEKKNDFVTFAGYYNGSGQKEKYGGWIRDYYDAFKKASAT